MCQRCFKDFKNDAQKNQETDGPPLRQRRWALVEVVIDPRPTVETAAHAFRKERSVTEENTIIWKSTNRDYKGRRIREGR